MACHSEKTLEKIEKFKKSKNYKLKMTTRSSDTFFQIFFEIISKTFETISEVKFFKSFENFQNVQKV